MSCHALELDPNLLTREEMRERLLDNPFGICGIVYHVGSEPGKNAFDDVIFPEAQRYGFLSWVQGTGELEGMNVQPYYHPEFGLVYEEIDDPGASGGKRMAITIEDPTKIEALMKALVSEEGIDLYPTAAAGWLELCERIEELPAVRVVKTHIATPSCSMFILDPNLAKQLSFSSTESFQELFYNALVRGHLQQLKRMSPVVIVSADNPSLFSVRTLREDLDAMFIGNEAIRAVHCCGEYGILEVMVTGEVDIVHWNAMAYPNILVGRPDVVRSYLDRGRMLGWGGVPQNKVELLELAKRMGMNIDIEEILVAEGRISKGDNHDAEVQRLYEDVVNHLAVHMDDAVDEIYARYQDFIDRVLVDLEEKYSEIDTDKYREVIIKQTFVSATCGYGTNDIDGLRAFSYALAQNVADRLHESIISEVDQFLIC